MKQKYRDKLISSAKKDQIVQIRKGIGYTEWEYRSLKCARRILAAVCFRENANNTYLITDSIILPIIGYYYALFHMGVAILYLEYRMELNKLEKIKHSKLINNIQDKLVNKTLVSFSFTELLFELKELREETNYSFGVMEKIELNDYYKKTGVVFDYAIDFIKIIDDVIKEYHPVLSDIIAMIGDGFGDDITSSYLSKEDLESVEDYLISKNLTT
ncbi:MAG: hypothetical protein ACTSRI_18120 [Promethearchaeota archaeon]